MNKSDHINKVIHELKDLASYATDLANRLTESGGPLTSQDKELIRMAFVPELRSATKDLIYEHLAGDEEHIGKIMEHIGHLLMYHE